VTPGMRVADLLETGTERLRAAGVATPRLDAELLLAMALDVDRTAVIAHHDALVGDGQAGRFEDALRRRVGGEPVAYIRGVREFHGLAFAVDTRALIPRPETELLVDLAVEEVAERLTSRPRGPGAPPVRVVDVGTGSGAVAVAVAVTLRRRGMLDEADLLAVDVSTDALDVARENAVGHGVAHAIRFEVADLLPAEATPVDVCCANLPYVPTAELAALPALAAEPAVALDGGEDGLDVVRRLLDRLAGALAPGGVALLEIGAGQRDAVSALARERLPSREATVLDDLAGLPRVVRVGPVATGTRAGPGSR